MTALQARLRWWGNVRPGICGRAASLGLILVLALTNAPAAVPQYEVLHRFAGGLNDGAAPQDAPLVIGPDGWLYGTTASGGFDCDACGFGAVFKIRKDGTEFQLLHRFAGVDGSFPDAGLLLVGSTLYGTAYQWGRFGFGTLFKVETDGSGFEVLRHFAGGANDGAGPLGTLVLDGNGFLYGTTSEGGAANLGTVFKISTLGTGFEILHSFAGAPANDGGYPYAGLVLTGVSLYGTTLFGGPFDLGTVFTVSTSGTGYDVLHSFDGNDGEYPVGGLVQDAIGVLYGTTSGGGAGQKGTVFKIATNGADYQVLKELGLGLNDGNAPRGRLALHGTGTLYGATMFGGLSGRGTVFTLQTDGSDFSFVHHFADPADGVHPRASVVVDNTGALYGTTQNGGSPADGGVIFKLTGIVVDTTPPTIDCTPPAISGWVGTNVSVSCTAGDNGSGLADPADAAFVLETMVSVGSQSTNAHTNDRTVFDLAGNFASVDPFGPYMIDRSAPFVDMVTPADGAVFTLGQAVAADYTCGDGGSGVASCSGSVPSGSLIDTSSGGTKTFTVNASDQVGNPLSVSVSYRVVAPLTPSTIVLDSQPNPSVAGRPVTLTATVTGTAPTGTVTFYADGFPLAGSWPLQATSATTATASTSAFLTAGSHSLHASYSGDELNASSTSLQVPHQVNAEDESSGTATKAMATNLTDDLQGGFGQSSEASVGSTGPFATVRSNLVAFGGLNFIGGQVGVGQTSEHGGIAGMRGVAYGTFTNTANEPLLQARADISGEFLGNAGLVISTVYVFDANLFLNTIRSSGQTLREFLLNTPVDTPAQYLAAGQPALSLARLFPPSALLATASRVFTATSYTNGTNIRLDATFPAAPGQSVIHVSDLIAYNGSAGTAVNFGQRVDFGRPQITYTMSAAPSSLALLTSSSKSSTLTLRSDNGVGEPVQLSTAWIGPQPTGVTATVSPDNVTVPASSTSPAAATVSINASPSASQGTFTLRVTGTSAAGVSRSVDLSIHVSATVLAAPTCGCTRTGPFQDPRVRGLVPQSSLATVTRSGKSVRVTRNDDGTVVVPDVDNESASGFSPNGKYFVLITQQSTLNGPVFSLTLYSVPAGGALGGSPLHTNPLSWGFSPDDDNRYFLVASSASLPTHVDVDIYNTHTGNRATPTIPVTAYSSWGQPPEWTDEDHVAHHDGIANGNDKVGGWGFSPDGHTFILSYKTDASSYLLSLYNLITGNPLVNSDVNHDVASFWQFSPCGDLFMWVHQQGANPGINDTVTFTFTSNGQPYPEANSLTLVPSGGNPSATVVAGSNGGRDIQLTGMSKATIPSPQCSYKTTAFSPVNIALTDPAGRRTGVDQTTGGTVNEIPGASYTGVGSEPQTITVPYASGAYLLIAYGLDTLATPEPYTLLFALIDASGDIVDRTILPGMAFRGSVHGFAFSIGDGPITPVPTEPADTTPPTIACASADGQWHASDVVLACTASDSQSGLANAADASFFLSTHVAAGSEAANASTDTRQVCDNAGNCSTAGPVTGNKVDKKGPSIASTAPAGEYLVGQVVAADYSCSDAGSGIASCVGTVANGANIDTASEGTKSFAITAIDVVGNKADVQITYRVVAAVRYTFVGFFAPIDMSTPDVIVWNTLKAGQTVPVKWLLTQNGAPVSDPASFLGLSSYDVPCSSGSGSVEQAIEQTASGNSGLQYNGGGNWQYNWKTPPSNKNTCRAVVVRFSDGTTTPPAMFMFLR